MSGARYPTVDRLVQALLIRSRHRRGGLAVLSAEDYAQTLARAAVELAALAHGASTAVVEVPERPEDGVVPWLLALPRDAAFVTVLHLERSFPHGIASLNRYRDVVSGEERRLLFLLATDDAAHLANRAPDFWRVLQDVGTLPAPSGHGDLLRATWEAAVELALEQDAADRADDAHRWRLLALGLALELDDTTALAESLVSVGRSVFVQRRYADAAVLAAAARRLPSLSEPLRAAIEELLALCADELGDAVADKALDGGGEQLDRMLDAARSASAAARQGSFFELFEPFVHDVAAAARGDLAAKEKVDATLVRVEQHGWRLTPSLRRVWAGERDANALLVGLPAPERRVVTRVLELLAADPQPDAEPSC